MKHYIIVILLALSVAGCKTKAVIGEAKAGDALSAEKIIERHYANEKSFKTILISASAKYRDDKQSQNLTAEIKIKKDEKILVSVRFLGITMAKALITPTEVKYYEKLNSSYFEGDYAMLSKWLGTDLDFKKVQNMLIGQAMDNLTKGKYRSTVEDRLYMLSSESAGTEKSFYFEAANLLIKRQEISQKARGRELKVSYPAHREYPEMSLPTELVIEAMGEEKKTSIRLEYNKVSFNEDLSFPYNAPGDYERIFID